MKTSREPSSCHGTFNTQELLFDYIYLIIGIYFDASVVFMVSTAVFPSLGQSPSICLHGPFHYNSRRVKPMVRQLELPYTFYRLLEYLDQSLVTSLTLRSLPTIILNWRPFSG